MAAYREAIELYPLTPRPGREEAELSLGRRIEADHAFNMAEKWGIRGDPDLIFYQFIDEVIEDMR